MKKNLKWGAIVLASLILINWISSAFEEEPEPIPERIEFNIEKSEVYGSNNDVLSVIPGKYAVVYKKGSILLKVRLKLNKQIDEMYEIDGPTVQLKNEMGANVANSDYDSSLSLGGSETSKMLSFLHAEPGTEQDFIFSDNYPSRPRTIMTETKSFTLEDLILKDPKEKEEKAEEEESNPLEEVVNEVKKDVSEDKELKEAVDDVEKAIHLSEKALEFTKSTLELTKEMQDLR